MRSFTSLLAAGMISVVCISPCLAQMIPNDSQGSPYLKPVHVETFEERGASYTLSSKKEIVAAWHVAVSRQVIDYCNDLLTIVVLPANTSEATSKKMMDQAHWSCVLQTFASERKKGELPPDAVLIKNDK